jgi:hypothetical protein
MYSVVQLFNLLLTLLYALSSNFESQCNQKKELRLFVLSRSRLYQFLKSLYPIGYTIVYTYQLVFAALRALALRSTVFLGSLARRRGASAIRIASLTLSVTVNEENPRKYYFFRMVTIFMTP